MNKFKNEIDRIVVQALETKGDESFILSDLAKKLNIHVAYARRLARKAGYRPLARSRYWGSVACQTARRSSRSESRISRREEMCEQNMISALESAQKGLTRGEVLAAAVLQVDHAVRVFARWRRKGIVCKGTDGRYSLVLNRPDKNCHDPCSESA